MIELGRVGLWTRELRSRDPSETEATIAELEALGYGTIWMPGQDAATFFPLAEAFLGATHRIAVASGILSVWTNDAAFVAAGHADLSARFPDRLLAGLGVSHPHLVERQTGKRFEHPLAVMREYLDALDATVAPIPRDELILAALGPKMLQLSAERTSGAHPYFVPVEHTEFARRTLGDRAVLAPEQAVVLETDPERARKIARRHMATYLRAPNYTNNLKRFGFGDDEIANGGSNRLVDAIVAWGDEEAIAARVRRHFDAGADHVCLQVIAADPDAVPIREWRALAPVVTAL